MAWPSTAEYYRLLNEEIGARLGGNHSARLLLWSFDFDEIEQLQADGEWRRAGELLAVAGARLAGAGAEGLLLCTNTMHRVAGAIEATVDIPLLHIADATASAVTAAGVERVGLLGTRFTMEQDFYRHRLAARGLDVLVPDAAERDIVHKVIYEELVTGQILRSSRDAYLTIIDGLAERGAQGVIAGCTEIELLVGPQDTELISLAYFPTTRLHVSAAADWMLG